MIPIDISPLALLASLALGAAPQTPPDGAAERVAVWLTTGDRAHLLERQPDLEWSVRQPEGGRVLEVDEATSHQEMVGFGAALTDASAWLMQTRMRRAQRDSLLRALFSPTDGIGLSFVRLTMGASDFSLTHYTYDDLPPGEEDARLERFSIEPDRAAVIPVLKQALALNPDLKLMASPWSPPAWMKTSGSLIGGRLRLEAYEPFARYFVKFLEAYRAEGIPIWALSVQNEPHHEPADYPGMRMQPAERARFVGRHLGPLLERSGFGEVRILEWDHNWDEPESPLAVLADSAARRYVDGVAWHCYGGEPAAQSAVHAAHPDKDAFFTECSGGDWAPSFADNLVWNVRTLVIGAVRHWARGVALWNLALDPEHGPHAGGCADCRGVVTVDPATGRWTPNEEYWALAHASRFVRPGARRIDSSSGVAGLESVAFRNPDGGKVLIVVNASSQERAFWIRTRGLSFDASLLPRAVATFTWD